MDVFFSSGLATDLVLAIMMVEGVLLLVYHRATGRGIAPSRLIPTLASGAFLVLALRAALTGAGWMAIAGLLGAALIAHLGDLAVRWNRRAGAL